MTYLKLKAENWDYENLSDILNELVDEHPTKNSKYNKFILEFRIINRTYLFLCNFDTIPQLSESYKIIDLGRILTKGQFLKLVEMKIERALNNLEFES